MALTASGLEQLAQLGQVASVCHILGLKPCAALRRPPPGFPVAELLGHAWQLTRSACAPLADGPRDLCPEGTFVRKGGETASTNPLECIPEFRSATPTDVAQPGTSFRLVLVESEP